MRFLMDLAAHTGEGNIPLHDVAQRQDISEKYLWQVVTPLKTAGLIRAVSGPGGGYMLAKEPQAISLGEILSVLEGNGAGEELGAPDASGRGNAGAAHEILIDVETRIGEILSLITLSDMTERWRARLERDAFTYVI